MFKVVVVRIRGKKEIISRCICIILKTPNWLEKNSKSCVLTVIRLSGLRIKKIGVSEVDPSELVCEKCGGTEFWGPYTRKSGNDRRYICVNCKRAFSVPILTPCVICGKIFAKNAGEKNTCSKECRSSYTKKWKKKYNERNKKHKFFDCVICGEIFIRVNNQKTCSNECSEILAKKNKKKYYENNREYYRVKGNTWKLMRRTKLIRFLGGVCVHCGFDNIQALEIDHIDGGGNRDVKRCGTNTKMYIFYLEHPEVAKTHLQVLCSNCNSIKRYENRVHSSDIDIIELAQKLVENESFDIPKYVKELGILLSSPIDPYSS